VAKKSPMVAGGSDAAAALHLVRKFPHSSLDHPALRHLFANASDLFAVADYR
jgi:hypothetical protein